MFNVKNKACINRISIKFLKNNRNRNIFAIIAIALTALMFTSLFVIGSSVLGSIQESTMMQVGTKSHAGFKNLSIEQYETVTEDSKVKDISYNIFISNPINKELAKDYTELRYTEEKCAEWGFCTPTTGRLPEKGKEIATTTDVLDALGVSHKLGEKVHLEFEALGKKYSEDFTLCGFWKKDKAYVANQAFISREYCDKVAPVWHDDNLNEYMDQMTVDPSYCAGSIYPSLWFEAPWNIEKQVSELKDRCGFGDDVDEGINWAYASSNIDITATIVIIGVLLLIFLSGYLIIYNVFYISVSNDIRFYGLLKTIGTTNRQLKQVVRRQAMLLSLIGIPIGLVLGFFVGSGLFPIIMKTFVFDNYAVHVNPLVFIGSAIFALITVWISCIRPCRLVKKISPVEAVSFVDNNKGKGKQRKTEKKIRNVSPRSMAWSNLRRSPKKTIAVVISLSLSVIILNSTVSIVKGFDMDKFIKNYAATDFYITDTSIENVALTEDNYCGVSKQDMEAFASIKGLTGSGAVYMEESGQELDEKTVNKELKNLDALKEGGYLNGDEEYKDIKEMLKGYYMPSHIYGIDQFIAEEGMDMAEGKIDWKKFNTGKYVIASTLFSDGELKHYDIGDKARVYFPDGSSKEYEVLALGDLEYSIGPEHSHGMDVYFTLPTSEYMAHISSKGALKFAFNIDESSFDEVTDFVSDYCENTNDSLTYKSKAEYVKEFKDAQMAYLAAGGVLSFILALVGILNFINAIVTSIQARKRELAVLQSVGMTGNQLKEMLVSEGLDHILITAVISLTVGSVITFGIVKAITTQMWFFSYRFVFLPELICIIAFIILAMVIPSLCYKSMCKESVVDRLRIGE